MKSGWLTAVLLLLTAPSIAQQTSPAAAPPIAPADSAETFKARSRLVLVPVVVTDHSGRHVAGLGKDLFRVEEDGKAQSVALFEEESVQKAIAPAFKPVKAVASNFVGDGSTGNHFTVVLLDMVNTPFLKQTEGRRQLMKYLTEGLPPDEPVALLGLNDKGVVQLHSFTTDSQVLLAALRKVRSSIASSEVADTETQQQTEQNVDLMSSADDKAQQISQFMQDSIDGMAALQQRNTIGLTLDALNQVAQAYGGSHARKTLIWASSGFPFMINDPHAFAHMGVDMVHQYEQTWRALTAANIAVYPVELVGLDSRTVDVTRSKATYQPGRSRHGNPMGTSAAIGYDPNVERQESLRAFAEATGGRPCLNSNDFKKCFADAVEDSRSYYLLGYYLTGREEKTGWHKLKVRVDAAGAHVRAREGFYVAPPAEDTPAARREQLLAALSSPFEYTGVVLDVRSDATHAPDANNETQATGPRKVMQDFMVHIPRSSLAVDVDHGNRIDLEIAAVALDRSGKEVSRFSQNVRAAFDPEMLARIAKTGVALKEQLELIPGTYDCRFVVRDNRSGELGTVHMPFELK